MPVVNTVETIESPQMKFVVQKMKEITVPMKDYVQRLVSTEALYTLNIKDTFSSDSIYNRNINVNLNISETFVPVFDKVVNVNIGIIEMFLNNAGMVITDIFKYNIAIDETNFDEALSPIGFSAFREMRTGDYTYKDAICKVRLEAQNSGDRPNIRQYVHKVDVPDVVESGVITLTSSNQPVTYFFKRKFHNIPEVNFSIKSSDVAGATFTPVTIDTEKIVMYLKSGTSNINGQVSFSARGY